MDIMAWYGANSMSSRTDSPHLQQLTLEWKDRALRHLRRRITEAEDHDNQKVGETDNEAERSVFLRLLYALCGTACTTFETSGRAKVEPSSHEFSQLELHIRGIQALLARCGGWHQVKMVSFHCAWLILW